MNTQKHKGQMKEFTENGNKKVHTFEDWLQGEIDDYWIFPEGANFRIFEDVKSINDLPKWVKVKNEDYSKIIEAKEYAYSFFLESMKKALIGKFVNSFLKSRSPEELIDIEIEECEEKINKDKRIKKEVIQGKIKSYNINSKQYKDAKERQKFYITLYINDHHTVDCYLSYRNWIKDFKNSDDTARNQLILDYASSLNENERDSFGFVFSKFHVWIENFKKSQPVGKYSIHDKFYESEKYMLQSFEREIERNGSYTTISKDAELLAKVYTPHLTLIFVSDDIPGFDMKAKQNSTFSGQVFFHGYSEAFKKGEQRFNDLYGKHIQRNAKAIYLNIPKNRRTARLIPEIIDIKVVERIGLSAGWFSRSKEILEDNPNLFEGLEQQELPKEALPETTVTEISSDVAKTGAISQTIEELKNAENQFWKGLPMEEVIKHFEVMTIRKNKAGNYFLTIEQLISFLKKGFLIDTTQPKQKINCSNGEKGFVIKRFYDFFTLAVSQYGHPQKKVKFINLFTDCFDNWEPSTVPPFFKPNKTKDKW